MLRSRGWIGSLQCAAATCAFGQEEENALQNQQQQNRKPKETAATVIDERDYKIKRLQEQIQELGYVPAVLPDSDDDGQDPSNFNL